MHPQNDRNHERDTSAHNNGRSHYNTCSYNNACSHNNACSYNNACSHNNHHHDCDPHDISHFWMVLASVSTVWTFACCEN